MKTFSTSKEMKGLSPKYGILMVGMTVLALVGAAWLVLISDKGSANYKTGFDVLLCGIPFLAISLVMILFTNTDLATTVDDDGIETKITRPFRKTTRLAWNEISEGRIATSGNITSLTLVSKSGKKMGFNSSADYFEELVKEVNDHLEKNGIPLIKE